MRGCCSPGQRGKGKFPGSCGIPTIAAGRRTGKTCGESLPLSKYGKRESGNKKPRCSSKRGNPNDSPVPSPLFPACGCLRGILSPSFRFRGDHPFAPRVSAHYRISGSEEVVHRESGDHRGSSSSPQGRDPPGGKEGRGNGRRHLGARGKTGRDGAWRGETE